MEDGEEWEGRISRLVGLVDIVVEFLFVGLCRFGWRWRWWLFLVSMEGGG